MTFVSIIYSLFSARQSCSHVQAVFLQLEVPDTKFVWSPSRLPMNTLLTELKKIPLVTLLRKLKTVHDQPIWISPNAIPERAKIQELLEYTRIPSHWHHFACQFINCSFTSKEKKAFSMHLYSKHGNLWKELTVAMQQALEDCIEYDLPVNFHSQILTYENWVDKYPNIAAQALESKRPEEMM